MSDELPKPLQKFIAQYPNVWEAYQTLGSECHESGPLDDQTRRLTKLAIAVGSGKEGAVRAHTRLALAQGLEPEALYHVALLATTTIGFPATIAAMSWMTGEVEKVTDK